MDLRSGCLVAGRSRSGTPVLLPGRRCLSSRVRPVPARRWTSSGSGYGASPGAVRMYWPARRCCRNWLARLPRWPRPLPGARKGSTILRGRARARPITSACSWPIRKQPGPGGTLPTLSYVSRHRSAAALLTADARSGSWSACYRMAGGLRQDAAMSAAPLTGQVAVVTGASRGIGKAVAVHLARQGAMVAGIARASPDLTALPHDAHAAAGRLLAIAADVTSAAEVQAAFARVDAELATPQLVVTCAGTADVLGPLWLADPQQWWHAVAVDLRGTMLSAQCAVTRMLAVGRGRLVTVYGNLGDRQQGHASAFAVAKAGIARLTESLACELEGTEVRVLGVHPGFVRTPMTEQLARGDRGRAWLPGFAESAVHRWTDAQPAADLITAIALGAADQLTGRILHPRDDLSALTGQCQSEPDRRRLRLDLS